MKFNSKAYNKDMEIIYDELFANHRNETYYGENGVVGSAPQGRHGTTKTFIYLEVQYNIEDTKHW